MMVMTRDPEQDRRAACAICQGLAMLRHPSSAALRPLLGATLLVMLVGCGARSELAVHNQGVAQAMPQSVVLFGGNGESNDYGDTWIWTPKTEWAQAHPAQSPAARSNAAAATWDGDVVLVGGDTDADTWVWDGTSWQQRHPTFSPPQVADAVAATLDQGVVLFGGNASGMIYHDAWVWDGSNWAPTSPSESPPARWAAAGAALDGSLVVFGGEDLNNLPMSDTWVYDGATWTQQHPAHSPSSRRGAVAAALDGQMVVFGGDTLPDPNGLWVSVAETWVWDGIDWTQRQPAVSPGSRSFAAMTAVQDELLLFGGIDGSAGLAEGTWTWNGTSWTEHTGPGPAPRNAPAMAAR